MTDAAPLVDRTSFFKRPALARAHLWTRARHCLAIAVFALCGLSIGGLSGDAWAQKRGRTKLEIKQSKLGGEIKQAQTRGVLSGIVSRAVSQGLVTNGLIEEMNHCMGTGSRRERVNCTYAVSQLVEPKHAGLILRRLQRFVEYEDDMEMRQMACTAIGRLGPKAGAPAIELLVKATEDAAAPVRREALTALGKLKAKKQGPAILKRALLDDEVAVTRQAAILALGEVGYTAAAKDLEGLLKHSSEVIRMTAAKSLCALDQPAGRRFTEALLHGEDEYMRRDAVWILRDLKPKWTVEAIAKLLDDKVISVQIEAAKALSLQKDMRGTRWLVLSAQKANDAEDYALVNRLEQAIEDAKVPSHQRKSILTEAGRAKKSGGKR
ncbi:MAG: HEAT repeat domain-containing protein [Myxococcaceae bacterium]|nr:HEAT repeat domain-containing protein [Myxococcaceae bacterium]